MLGGYWLSISALLFVASLILHQAPLLLVSVVFFLAGGAARLWDRYCLTRVEYRRRLSTDRVFFGGEVQLEIEIANRKPLPLPWVQIDEEIPQDVTLLKGQATPATKQQRAIISHLLPLSWYHVVRRRYPMRCLQRGYFAFGPTRIRSGDLFGFFRRETEIQSPDYLMVYPRMVPLERLGIPSKQLFGDIRLKRHLFQDPVLSMGIRDYHFGDSLRRIHWKSSARLGRLQTRVFEPTTTVDMAVFLDVRTTEPPSWGFVPRLLETAIVAAASIARCSLTEGYRVGLYVNQDRRFSSQLISVSPSQHSDQLMRILEVLSPLHPWERLPIARLVLNENRNLPWGSTVVAITAVPTGELLSALAAIRKVGRSVALIVVGGNKPPTISDGLITYHIPEDVAWHELETIGLKGK